METLEKHEGLQSRLLKSKRLCLQVKVESDATPANKSRSSDLAGVAIISTEGQDEAADLGVTLAQTPDDGNGLFSVILDKAAMGDVHKINKVETVAVSGGGTSTVTASYIDNGYIVIDLNSSVDLSAADAEIQIIVDYQKK